MLQLSEASGPGSAPALSHGPDRDPTNQGIEDFQAIWQFLGWIDDTSPLAELMAALEETGLTEQTPRSTPPPASAWSTAASSVAARSTLRQTSRSGGSPTFPVELDDKAARSIREADDELAHRMVAQYENALARRRSGSVVEGIDHDLVRRIATRERKEATTAAGEENVFAMMRRIGRAKAGLAADYAAQLARSAGKVVFFAKHVDVMDAAEAAFTKAGIRFSSIRGDQTRTVRQKQIDAFVKDPAVAIAVCSLTAAGVGINLQVASNIVLAELSWTDAEQTQAIDRSHRIGQTEPVTAWRIIAAQTIDARIAELIDSKAGLAARALDGSEDEVSSSADVQLEALVALLTEALTTSP